MHRCLVTYRFYTIKKSKYLVHCPGLKQGVDPSLESNKMVFPQAWQTARCEPAPLYHGPEFCGLKVTIAQERHFFLVNGPSGILSTLTTKWKLQDCEFPFQKLSMTLSRDARLLWAMSASAEQLIKSNFSAVFVSVNRLRYQLFKHPFGNKLEWNFTKEKRTGQHRWKRSLQTERKFSCALDVLAGIALEMFLPFVSHLLFPVRKPLEKERAPKLTNLDMLFHKD